MKLDQQEEDARTEAWEREYIRQWRAKFIERWIRDVDEVMALRKARRHAKVK
jgi:hypothetical protein